MEVLLLKRHPRLDVHGGSWVFPGGGIASEDRSAAGDTLEAARQAAVRELQEESGLALRPDQLVAFQQWTTPEGLPRRFHVWFFASEVTDGKVTVDQHEIVDYSWKTPMAALHCHGSGKMTLPAPTFVTLTRLAKFTDPGHCLSALRRGPVMAFTPKLLSTREGLCALYEGDAGYETADPYASGPQHRLWMKDAGWHYVNDA
jgi:ADP-ribose pyrophosphatase YjhB (NUDIX family)